MFNKFVIVLTLFTSSFFAIAASSDSNPNEPKRVFQISYLNQVNEYKTALNASLERLRLELTEKKYPQAYFIKSIQSQVAEMSFKSENDFKNLEEQLFSLLQSINSQSNANRSLSHIRYDNEVLHISMLNKLKRDFRNENEIIPTYIYNAANSDSHTVWQKIIGTTKEFSTRDEGIIFFTVLSGYLFLLMRRKLGAVAVKPKGKEKIKTQIPMKAAQASTLSSATNKANLVNAQIDLTSMEGVGICRVNSRDQIVFMNPQFVSSFGKQKVWRTFFTDTFLKDQRIDGATNLYQLKGESDSRFLVQTTEKEANGVKTIFIWDLSWSTTAETSSNVHNLPEVTTYHDLLEDAVIKFQSFSRRMKIIGADELRVSEESLEDQNLIKMTENYVKVLFQVANFKNATEEIILKVDETDKRCLLSAFIPGVQIRPEDLNQQITLGLKKNETKTLNNIFKAMKTDHSIFAVEFKIKNVFNSKSSGLYLDLSFDKEIEVNQTAKSSRQTVSA